jgi:hypothetical protein
MTEQAGSKKHHHWKLWLSVVLILGIAGLLLYTQAANKSLGLSKIGNFIKNTPSEGDFFFQLNSDEESFYKQSYKIANSSFVAIGICQNPVKVSDVNVNRDGVQCKIELTEFSGTFDYTQGGAVLVSGKAVVMKIDDSTYSSTGGLKVTFELIPANFTLSDFSADKIVLATANGNVSKIKGGAISVVGYLNNELLEIDNFDGSLKLEGSQLSLQGMANSIKSQDFEW